MANKTIHTAYTQSIATALATDLNSLGNATLSPASAAIDNTSALDLFMDLELVVATQASARSAGATVTVLLTQALGGTTYDDSVSGVSHVVAVFPLDAATTARRSSRRGIQIPPGLFKLSLLNSTGQAFAASGNTLSYRTRALNNNG